LQSAFEKAPFALFDEQMNVLPLVAAEDYHLRFNVAPDVFNAAPTGPNPLTKWPLHAIDVRLHTARPLHFPLIGGESEDLAWRFAKSQFSQGGTPA
jgi:hypothetical protein